MSPSATSPGPIPRHSLSPLPGNDPISLSDTFGVQVLTVMLVPAQTVPFGSCSPESQKTAPIHLYQRYSWKFGCPKEPSLSCSASLGEWQQERVTGAEGNSSPIRMKTISISTADNGFNKTCPTTAAKAISHNKGLPSLPLSPPQAERMWMPRATALRPWLQKKNT